VHAPLSLASRQSEERARVRGAGRVGEGLGAPGAGQRARDRVALGRNKRVADTNFEAEIKRSAENFVIYYYIYR
jgi:hypothetical protein